jgi:hypothetical protein
MSATTATTLVELTAEAQKQALSAFKQAQDLSLRSAELALGLVHEQPADAIGTLPTPTELVEGWFSFAGQVLHQQKSYALRLTGLMGQTAEPRTQS